MSMFGRRRFILTECQRWSLTGRFINTKRQKKTQKQEKTSHDLELERQVGTVQSRLTKPNLNEHQMCISSVTAVPSCFCDRLTQPFDYRFFSINFRLSIPKRFVHCQLALAHPLKLDDRKLTVFTATRPSTFLPLTSRRQATPGGETISHFRVREQAP